MLRRSLSGVETAKKLVVIDSTIVKAHPHSAGALRRLGRQAPDHEVDSRQIQAADMQAIIPSRANRRIPRPVSRHLYARRNIIERWFGRLKIFRRVATRYEKTALSYLGFVAVAAWLIALTGWR